MTLSTQTLSSRRATTPGPFMANGSRISQQIGDFIPELFMLINPATNTVESVVSKYNLRNISYRDLQSMAKELHDKGALKSYEYLDFLPPSSEFAFATGIPEHDLHHPIDYLSMIEERIEITQTYFPDLSTEYWERQFDLLTRFVQQPLQTQVLANE